MAGQVHPKTVNIFVGFFFMVNFVLGTGFLGLPFTFFHGGLIAGICTLIIIAFMTWQSALYELEAMGRAQEIWDFKHPEENPDKTEQPDQTNGHPKYQIKVTRKFEPSELCEVFVGKWLKVVYLLILTAYSFLACLSYSTVTGSAWSVNIPLNFGSVHQCTSDQYLHHIVPSEEHCLNAYRFSLMLFAVLVIPLSLLDLKEQAVIQFLLGVLRFLTLGSIIAYCVINSFMGNIVDVNIGYVDILPANQSNDSIDILDDAGNLTSLAEIATYFDFKGWVVGIPVIVYAFILHQGIPGLTHPIKEKHWLRGYFNILFITITLLYLILGVTGALWFRDIVNETITLNWGPLTKGDHSIALKILSYYIIFFPSIDVCSVYPLVIHTIVNNIYTVIFGRDTSQEEGWKLIIIQKSMKFVLAFLPIVIGLFVSNLVYVLKYAGLAGFFVLLVFPITLQLSSQWVCYRTFNFELPINSYQKEHGLSDSTGIQGRKADEETSLLGNQRGFKQSLIDFFFSRQAQKLSQTPYSTFLSHPLFVIAISCLAIGIFGLTLVSLAVPHPKS